MNSNFSETEIKRTSEIDQPVTSLNDNFAFVQEIQIRDTTIYLYYNYSNQQFYVPLDNIVQNLFKSSSNGFKALKIMKFKYPDVMHFRLCDIDWRTIKAHTLQLMLSLDGLKKYIDSINYLSHRDLKQELYDAIVSTMNLKVSEDNTQTQDNYTQPQKKWDDVVKDFVDNMIIEEDESKTVTVEEAIKDEGSSEQNMEPLKTSSEEIITPPHCEYMEAGTLLIGLNDKDINDYLQPIVKIIHERNYAYETTNNQNAYISMLLSENARLQAQLDKKAQVFDIKGFYDDIRKLSYELQHIQSIVTQAVTIWATHENDVVDQCNKETQQQYHTIYTRLEDIIQQTITKPVDYKKSMISYIVGQANLGYQLLIASYQTFNEQGGLKYLLFGIRNTFKLNYLNTAIFYLNNMCGPYIKEVPYIDYQFSKK